MNSVRDYLLALHQRKNGVGEEYEISSCPQLIERVQQLGFLPLLDSGIAGYCAEEMMAPDYHYVPAIRGRDPYSPPYTAGVLRTNPCTYAGDPACGDRETTEQTAER